MSTKITCQQDGSYSLKFPWKENHPPLPTNYNVCSRRTHSLARRLAQTPESLKMYGDTISEQLESGYIEPLPLTDTHCIPYHPVKKDSLTTPICIVYDCSCRQSQMFPSLNDCLVAGPTLLNDMCGILLRFDLHNYGTLYIRRLFFMSPLMKQIETTLDSCGYPTQLTQRVLSILTASKQFYLDQ